MELTKRNATYKAGDLEANEYDSKTDGKTRPGNVVERSVGFLSSTNGKRLLVCLVVLYIVHWVVVNLIKGTDGSRSDGLSTKVLPQTIARGHIHNGTIAGKLNGVIPATTPSG